MLEFSLEILKYLLRDRYEFITSGKNDKIPIHQIQLYEETISDSDNNTLVLIPFLPDDKLFSDCFCLYICSKKPADNSKTIYNILLCGENSFYKVANDILFYFNEFNSWKNFLITAPSDNIGIQKIVDKSHEFLNQDIIITNDSFGYVAYSDKNEIQKKYYDFQGSQFNTEKIQGLYIMDKKFDKTFSAQGITYYPKLSDTEKNCYFRNIFYQKKFMARIIIISKPAKTSRGALNLYNYLCKILEEKYLNICEKMSRQQGDSIIYKTIRELIRGENVSQTDIYEILNELGWQMNNTYQIACFIPDANGNSSLNLQYLCQELEGRYQNSIAVQRNGKIFLILNNSLPLSPVSFKNSLAETLQACLCKTGVSNEFTDFCDVRLYASQALEAISIGEKSNPTLWYYFFSDYITEYYSRKITEKYPTDDVCHPAVKILKKYDIENPGTDLLKTLYVYLKNNCNASHAADELFIHRTTFLYRMKKIENLINLDLEDWKTNLSLRQSYTLLEFDSSEIK